MAEKCWHFSGSALSRHETAFRSFDLVTTQPSAILPFLPFCGHRP